MEIFVESMTVHTNFKNVLGVANTLMYMTNVYTVDMADVKEINFFFGDFTLRQLFKHNRNCK